MNRAPRVSSPEERQETGVSFLIIGFMLWFFDLLILFFLPAGLKIGNQRGFTLLIGSCAVVGLTLLIIGYRMRASAK